MLMIAVLKSALLRLLLAKAYGGATIYMRIVLKADRCGLSYVVDDGNNPGTAWWLGFRMWETPHYQGQICLGQ
jgi:hypothetical protein